MKKETIIRTALLVFALLNQLLTSFGWNPLPFSEEALYDILSTVLTAGMSLWSWWKNNSFTKNAIKADEYLNVLKRGEEK